MFGYLAGKATAPSAEASETGRISKASAPMPGKPGAPEVKAAPSAPYAPKPVKQETSSSDQPKPTKAAALVEEVTNTSTASDKKEVAKEVASASTAKAPAGKEEAAKAPEPKGKSSTSVESKPTQSATIPSSVGKAPAPKTSAVAPTSAAAVMEEGKKPISAKERIDQTGSAVSRGTGAKAEPAQTKAKAKAKVAAPPAPATAPGASVRNKSPPLSAKAAALKTATKVSTPPLPAKATANTRVAGSESAPTQIEPLIAPASVLSIVTGKPVPAQETCFASSVTPASSKPVAASAPNTANTANSNAIVDSSRQDVGHQHGSLGPGRSYAAIASPFIPPPATKGPSGNKLDVPKEGPAAVAVGRAFMAGDSQPMLIHDDKPVAPVSKKYQICFVTSEVAPFSKTGGLGEAMDGLPTALAALGHRVMVIAPRYDQYKDAWDTGHWSSVSMGSTQESVHFFHAFKQKVDYVFVDHPTFLERVDGLTGSKLYGPEWGKDFADNQARFAYFCKAALLAIQELSLGGFVYGDDCVVVCNDWHSALVPMFIHAERSASQSKWGTTKTAFLCHNAVFQGRFMYEEGIAEVMGVPEHYIESITFSMPLRVGKYNEKVTCVNTMAAGLRYSDRALTVSPSYAIECAKDPDKGVELEELFALGRVTGILNGVKEGVSPLDQNFVTKTMMSCGTFSAATADIAKEELKVSYRAQNSLPAIDGPLLCFIGRLDAQKGYDLLLEALIEVLQDTEMQVVIVGAGRADLVAQTRAVEKKFPGKFFYGGWMGPERYALLAACDFTLLPSRWEPCGLVQMEAMRVGTCPIVAPTGGLKDTVEDGLNGLWTDSEMTVEAEVDEASVASIACALRRASKIFIDEPAKMVEMKKAAMSAAAEFTWTNAALQYEAVFEELGAKDVLHACKDVTVTLETDRQVC